VTDPAFRSPAWRAICDTVRIRSRGLCEIPGCCMQGEVFAISRSARGADNPSDVRHLCRAHDSQDVSGQRRGAGVVPRRLRGRKKSLTAKGR